MKKFTLLVCTTAAACSATPPPPQHLALPPSNPPPATPPPVPVEAAPADGVEVGGSLLAPMPKAVTSFGAARVGDHIYTLGGYHGKPHQYSSEGQSKDLWRLSISKNTWERVGALTHGVQGASLVAVGNEVCRVGGTRILNAAGEETQMLSIATAACFDTQKRTWRDLPQLPAGRSSHEATVIGKTIYVAGGWQLGKDGAGPKQATWHEDILSLDTEATPQRWQSHPAPFKRRALDVVAVDGKVAVVGGLTPSRKIDRTVTVFDPASKTWSEGPDFGADAFGVAAVNVGGQVFAAARDGVVRRLDREAWTPVTSLAFPRFFHRLVDSGEGDIIAVGGITGMQTIGRTRHTERVSLNAPAGRMHRFSFPHPGKSKNRQGIFLEGDTLYMFGGNNSLGQHDFARDNFLSEGWRVHLPSMRAAQTAAYPHARQTMQTIVVTTKNADGDDRALGISLGGFGHPETVGGKTQAVSHLDGYAFDFAKKIWEPRGGLPRGRTQFGLASHGGQLWVFGGLNYDPARKGKAAFQHVTSILTGPIQGSEPLKKTTAQMPAPRRAFAGATLGEHYYMVGGMKEGFQLVEGCLRFSFADQKFSEFPCPSENRLSAKLVPLGGKLYVLGGSVRGADKKMKSSRSVEMFDPVANTWRTVVDDVGFDTKHMRAFPYRGRLLMVTTHVQEPRIEVMMLMPDDPDEAEGGR